MSRTRLRQSQIHGLRPRHRHYTVRDTELRGFGVRVAPSGAKRFFLHVQHAGTRVWKDCGDALAVTVAEARARATAELAALHNASDTQPIPFETVAEEVFRRYGRRWKPRTMKVNRSYYRCQILPWFRGRPITAITGADVQAWFASLRGTPVAADRAAPVLSVILREAEAYGHRPEDTNPCKGIRRYRRRGRERFLTPGELHRLGAVLRRHDAERPLATAAIRLILLTGCRMGEILTLAWSSYREGRLYLPDSKTGPRTIWLSSAARDILDGLPRRRRHVFPGTHARFLVLQSAWQLIRRDAGLDDVRLHDLRHTYASIAILSGENLPTVSRLLGHNDPATTLKYVHLSDDVARQAVQTVAPILGGGG
jgi:integrase